MVYIKKRGIFPVFKNQLRLNFTGNQLILCKMKTNSAIRLILLFTLFLLTGCSDDDNAILIQDEYLITKVNGENFNADPQNGLLFAQKQITSNGTITLLAKVENEEGKIIEFRILNYLGKRNYPIGNRQFLEQGSFVNGNLCNYMENNSSGIWSTENDIFHTGTLPNFVEITSDEGSYIKGNFSFEAHEKTGASAKMVSEGKFSLKVRP